MLDKYIEHPLVGEVLIINNVTEPIRLRHPKIRVLQQTENIFVYPAWNLGVAASSYPFLAIINDDLRFSTAIFDHASKWLRRPGIDIVGPHPYAYEHLRRTRPWIQPVYDRTYGFGTLMLMRRERYCRIPNDLKIWFGDDWLFRQQVRRNWYFGGIHIETPVQHRRRHHRSFELSRANTLRLWHMTTDRIRGASFSSAR